MRASETSASIRHAFSPLLREIFPEPGQRFAPGRLRGVCVIARPAVVVEGVIDAGIDDLAKRLAVLRHRGLDRRDVLVYALVTPSVDRAHRRPDGWNLGVGYRDAVERDGRAQLGQRGGNAPGDGSAEAEPDHARAVDARRHLRLRECEPAPEILDMA